MSAGRRSLPGEMTSGVSSGSRETWRYWTRVDGVVTFGPRRHDRDQAAQDLKDCLAGNPPAKKTRPGTPASKRLKMGLCLWCMEKALPKRQKCARHAELDRERGERKRRQAGMRPLSEYQALLASRREGRPPRKPKLQRVLTRNIRMRLPGAKRGKIKRCRCGLLLPCYHSGIEEYASARPGDGNVA